MLLDPIVVAQRVCTPNFSASFTKMVSWFSCLFETPNNIGYRPGDRLKAVLKYLLQRKNVDCFFFHGGENNTRLRMRKGGVDFHERSCWMPGAAQRLPSPGPESFSKNPDGEAILLSFGLASEGSARRQPL